MNSGRPTPFVRRRPAFPIGRRPAPVVRRPRGQLAGQAVAFALLFVTWIAAPLEVGGRGRPTDIAGFDVIAFVPDRLPQSVHFTPSKIRRRPELKCLLDVDRDVFRPPFEVVEIGSIEEHAV